MRVLYIPSWFPSIKNPLAGSFIKELALDLSSPEIEIIVAAFHQNFSDLQGSYTEVENISENLNVYHHFGWSFPKINKFAQNSWIKTCIDDIETLLEENHFDFIHAHDYVSSFLALKLSKKTNIPFICTMHHSDFISDSIPNWRKELLKEVFENAYKTIVPSNALKNAIMDSYNSEDITLIPNYIDSSKIKAKETLAEIPMKLIAVSSNEAVKNNFQFYNFAEKNSIKIDLYGEIEKHFESSEFVNIKGPIAHNELLNSYHQYDGLISMSTIETFGLSIMEALTAGLPVLINNEYGSKDFVDETNGLIIEDHSSTWKKFNEKYKSFTSENIRAKAKSTYDKKIVIETYTSLYRKIYSNLCVV